MKNILVLTKRERRVVIAIVLAFLAPEINHGVCDRRVTIDAVGAAPKKQIARLERVEFKSVIAVSKDGLEVSGFADPGILFTRVARNIGHAALRENVINETRAIHSSISRIGRAIFVVQILTR